MIRDEARTRCAKPWKILTIEKLRERAHGSGKTKNTGERIDRAERASSFDSLMTKAELPARPARISHALTGQTVFDQERNTISLLFFDREEKRARYNCGLRVRLERMPDTFLSREHLAMRSIRYRFTNDFTRGSASQSRIIRSPRRRDRTSFPTPIRDEFHARCVTRYPANHAQIK